MKRRTTPTHYVQEYVEGPRSYSKWRQVGGRPLAIGCGCGMVHMVQYSIDKGKLYRRCRVHAGRTAQRRRQMKGKFV